MKKTMQAVAVAVLGMALAAPVWAYGTKSVSGYGIKVTRDADNPRLFHVTGTPSIELQRECPCWLKLSVEDGSRGYYDFFVPYKVFKKTPIDATGMVDNFERAFTVIIMSGRDRQWTVGVIHSGSRPSGQHPTQAQFNIDPNDPFKCEVSYNIAEDERYPLEHIILEIYRIMHQKWLVHHGPVEIPPKLRATVSCPRFHWGQHYSMNMKVYNSDGTARSGGVGDSYVTPPLPAPSPSNPEPTPPTEAASCGHVAIVPTMPKALSGGEDAADHWLRISNPSAASISVTVDGRDRAGTKGGTYRRELPAYRSVRVNMRDVEAAFDVTDPEGWWTLTVAGSGPLYAAATMRQGAATRFIPVERPATCTTGAVTRAGG